MNKQELVEFLLANAGESIKYRLHRELLGTSTNDPIMSQRQERILKQRRVQKIFSYQHADGWIGDNIHGGVGTGLDASIFALRDYGVEANNEGLRRAKHALLRSLVSIGGKVLSLMSGVTLVDVAALRTCF